MKLSVKKWVNIILKVIIIPDSNLIFVHSLPSLLLSSFSCFFATKTLSVSLVFLLFSFVTNFTFRFLFVTGVVLLSSFLNFLCFSFCLLCLFLSLYRFLCFTFSFTFFPHHSFIALCIYFKIFNHFTIVCNLFNDAILWISVFHVYYIVV